MDKRIIYFAISHTVTVPHGCHDAKTGITKIKSFDFLFYFPKQMRQERERTNLARNLYTYRSILILLTPTRSQQI